MPIDFVRAFNDLAADISDISESKGFWDPTGIGDLGMIPTKLALVNTEVAEALEVHRNSYDDTEEDISTGMTAMQEDDFTEEIADGLIRYLDMAGYYDLPIGQAVVAKIEKNRSRPYLHGKRY